MLQHDTTRLRQDTMSGEHARPRVFYSVASPNSREDGTPVEAAVSAANVQLARPLCSHGPMGRLFQEKSRRNGSQSRGYSGGFTLVELLVTVGVLVVLVLLFTQLLNSAASITTLGHKQMDADSQARQLLDRIAIDVAQMVKRSDVDYFAKGTAAPNSVGGAMAGNDQIAFFSSLSGYYPTPNYQSPISLIAYRINSDSNSSSYNKMERMAKGFIWNGVSSIYIPIIYLNSSNTTISSTWPAAVSSSTNDSDYEAAGPQVFRFEYYYLLKGQADPVTNTTYASVLSATPWDSRLDHGPSYPQYRHIAVKGMEDVAAVVLDIAVIDPKSRVLVPDAQIANLAGQLVDYSSGMTPGQLLTNWRSTIDANTIGLPRPVISGIRVYERYFYLSPPTLGTP